VGVVLCSFCLLTAINHRLKNEKIMKNTSKAGKKIDNKKTKKKSRKTM
jgi:hypothetical protein